MGRIVIAIIIVVAVVLLAGLVHSLTSHVPFLPAIQDVIGGIIGAVGELGNAIGRALSNSVPRPAIK